MLEEVFGLIRKNPGENEQASCNTGGGVVEKNDLKCSDKHFLCG